jgi:uncharacterized protein YcgI (DUF1989 family)
MAERRLIAAGGGAGLRLKRGQHLRIVDIDGGQTGDLVAFSADGRHRSSAGRTFDYAGKIYISTGDALWSDRSEAMLTIVADDVGKHDLLYAPCSMEMYRLQYGATEYHANCYDNLCSAFRELGIEPEPLPSSLNFFMNAHVAPDGRLSLLAPRTRAGAALTVRADMDLLIALTSCPTPSCNAGGPIKPLEFETF